MARQKRSGETRERIMETAAVLFLEKGYTATTVRDICSATGISLSRVNYHFSGKAALAAELCRELLQNFYAEMKRALQNERSYSFVTEAIALRFLVDLVVGTGGYAAGTFYRDAAREGILADSFTPGDLSSFEQLTGHDVPVYAERQEQRLNVYSKLFAASLSALPSCWEDLLKENGSDAGSARLLLQNIIAGLFMQMLDLPHDAQRAMVELSEAYYSHVRVELNGLTDVRVIVTEKLTLGEKVRIIEPVMNRDKIHLRSSPDRTGIELDTEKTDF